MPKTTPKKFGISRNAVSVNDEVNISDYTWMRWKWKKNIVIVYIIILGYLQHEYLYDIQFKNIILYTCSASDNASRFEIHGESREPQVYNNHCGRLQKCVMFCIVLERTAMRVSKGAIYRCMSLIFSRTWKWCHHIIIQIPFYGASCLNMKHIMQWEYVWIIISHRL